MMPTSRSPSWTLNARSAPDNSSPAARQALEPQGLAADSASRRLQRDDLLRAPARRANDAEQGTLRARHARTSCPMRSAEDRRARRAVARAAAKDAAPESSMIEATMRRTRGRPQESDGVGSARNASHRRADPDEQKGGKSAAAPRREIAALPGEQRADRHRERGSA